MESDRFRFPCPVFDFETGGVYICFPDYCIIIFLMQVYQKIAFTHCLEADRL